MLYDDKALTSMPIRRNWTRVRTFLISNVWGLTAGILLLTGYVLLANDGRHHWHEFRHLYSATFYSTQELMQGVFDPGPAPIRTPEQVAGWYGTTLFHTFLLHVLVDLFGIGLASYVRIKAVYAAMTVVTVGLIGATLHVLGMQRRRTLLTAILFLLSPISIYLGFKLLPAVPSLLFSMLAAALYTWGHNSEQPPYGRVALITAAGAAFGVGVLTSWYIPFTFLGFWFALVLVWVSPITRTQLIRDSLLLWIAAMVIVVAGLWLLGGSVTSYAAAVLAVIVFSKSLPMWMFATFNLALLGAGLWLLVPLAWLSPALRARRFFVIWLAVSALPVIVMSLQFLEPRYLAGAMVPFVALTALGVDALWERSADWRRSAMLQPALAGMIVVVLLVGTIASQYFMPYEADAGRLIQAVQTEAPSDETVVLLPWNYSDYHMLRFVFPEKSIYLVQSAATEAGELVDDSTWTARRAAMYGDRYLANATDLAPLNDRRMVLIGWTILPSLQNLHDVIAGVGVNRLAGWLDAAGFLNHMEQTWFWTESAYLMRGINNYGQYRVYEVVPARPTQQESQLGYVEPGAETTEPATSVSLWGIFETDITNTGSYANPFVDTELTATFTAPSGTTYDFFGFYNGDGAGGQSGSVWTLRFMCSEAGTWSWSASFTDGAPGDTGSFQCLDDGAYPGPLRVDPANPRWLVQADGSHFYPRWYYLHELLFAQEGTWQQDVDTHLVGNNYNMVSLLFTQADVLVNNNWNYHTYEQPHFYPWVRTGGTVQWDRFNLASWHKFDRVLTYLRDRGIYVYNFDGFFPNLAPRFPDDPALEQRYLRYAVARTGAYWNVTHNVTFEFSEFMSTSRLTRIGSYIDNIDPFDLLTTVHDTQNYDALVQNQSWLDFANLQYDEGRAPSAAVSNPFVRSHDTAGKPVASTEVVWEGDNKLTADEVRKGAWGVLTAGSFPLYGEFDFGGAGVGPYGAGGAHPYLQIMFDFVESIPYWTMAPCNALVDSGSYCLGDGSSEFLVYAEDGGPVTIDLSGVSGTFAVEWLNPRTGTTSVDGATSAGASRTFTTPAGDANDWVLHLDSTQDPPTSTPSVTATSTVSVSPTPSAIPERASACGTLMTDVTTSTGKSYEIGTLDVGRQTYIDRTFTFTSIPPLFRSEPFIRTANDDKNISSSAYLTFTLEHDATIYVAYDDRVDTPPGWLDSSWTLIDDTIDTTDVERRLYKKQFAAGSVTLGGNAMTPMSGANSNYNVIVLSNTTCTRVYLPVITANNVGQFSTQVSQPWNSVISMLP